MGFFGSKKVSKAPGPPPPPPPPPLASASSTPANNSRSPPPPRYQQASQPPPTDQPYSHSQQWYPYGAYSSQATFQPAGLLPSPPGWTGSTQPVPPPYNPPPPIIVNQHYYLGPPPGLPHPRPQTSGCPLQKHIGSVLDLAETLCPGTGVPKLFDDNLMALSSYGTQLACQSAVLHDQLTTRFNDVMTMVEQGRCTGNEPDLFLCSSNSSPPQASLPSTSAERKPPKKSSKKSSADDQPKDQTTAVASSMLSTSYIAKAELYANSRLPLNLPPLKLYIPTYPLLCLAAQYSNRVYETPKGSERDFHINSDWRSGTKAMVIKSVPMDYMNTIVFAIRGTASFMDWAVNLNTEQVSPAGFLDDPGNFCHSGFLSVARKMVSPVAQRLRQLLEENAGRSSYSLLITGHSAGGAVAALLYSHMLAKTKEAESVLNKLTDRFRRVHCVTFGSPPVSLLPLTKPTDLDERPHLRKSLFLSFVNEGDPVARADKAYVRSLLELFAAPAPASAASGQKEKTKAGCKTQLTAPKEKKSKASLASAKSGKSGKVSSSARPGSSGSSNSSAKSKASGPVWKVPPSTLSNAGRIVVLRSGDPKSRLRGKKTVEERLNEGVVAYVATDEQLRGVVWGDPVAHVMKLYSGRIETLAVGAVTAKGY